MSDWADFMSDVSAWDDAKEVEIARLRAAEKLKHDAYQVALTEIEALREAGEAMEAQLNICVRFEGQQEPIGAALARWREVAGEKPDVGPPAPGEGDHLPNPEAEMAC